MANENVKFATGSLSDYNSATKTDGKLYFTEDDNGNQIFLGDKQFSPSKTQLTWYGTCSTEAATAAKVVTCASFNLTTGVVISIKFTNANTVANPTLNINSTTAHSIVAYGAAATNGIGTLWAAGAIVTFIYDGTNYNILNTSQSFSIPFGQVDSTSIATTFTATVPGITELHDGVCAYIKNGVITSAAATTAPKTFTMNVNGLGAKPVYSSMAAATLQTTQFNVNYTMLFIYNSTRVAGGCWDMFYGYNSDTNTIAYNIRHNASTYLPATTLYRYEFLFTYSETQLLPVNAVSNKPTTYTKALTTEAFDPFRPIYYYTITTTVATDTAISVSYLYTQYSTCDYRYSFNVNTSGSTAFTLNKDIYLVCEPQSNGLVKLYQTAPLTQTLPSTEDGLVYIYMGRAYSAYQGTLSVTHPIYYYKNGALRLWVGAQELPTLATVATTGSYNDLTDKPTIPDISGLATKASQASISIEASASWTSAEDGSYYINISSQISNPTNKTQIDIKPTKAVVDQMFADGCYGLQVQNNNGVIRLYAFGAALTSSVEIPYTKMEVA